MRRALAVVIGGIVALVSPEAAGAQATTFQGGPAHAGHVRAPGVNPPLRRAWTRRFPARVSYPVIADGRVFVTAQKAHGRGSQVVALSARSGRRLWRHDLGPTGGGHAAYEDGRLFVTHPAFDGPGLLAFDAADGRLLWQQEIYQGGAPPVAVGGVVYTSGAFAEAYRATDGARLWRTLTSGSGGTPTVSGDTVYLSFACGQVYALDRGTGQERWHAQQGCSGGGASTPVLHRNRLYVREDADFPRGDVYDAATGARTGRLRADLAPAFAGALGLFPHSRANDPVRIVARSAASGRVRWRFRGDGYLDTPPLIVNRTAYVGSGSGRVYGVSLRSGRVRWRTRLPLPVLGSESGWVSGLAAGGGRLVVPTYRRLVAFR